MQALISSDSTVSDGRSSRRVTSQRLLCSFSTVATKPPRKEGTLGKYSPALFKSWQQRHVVLNEGILKYYKHVGGDQMQNQGTLNFDLYCCFVTLDARHKK